MAVDVSQMQRREGGQLEGGQDQRVMQRVVVIAGVSLALLVAMKIGFLQRVMP
jgi:hypothetical protein